MQTCGGGAVVDASSVVTVVEQDLIEPLEGSWRPKTSTSTKKKSYVCIRLKT